MDIKATVKDVIASVVGSAACVYTGQPFDTVKVRMQVSHWSSSYECARSTFSNEGVVSLWKGSVPAFLGALSENAVAFAVNGILKRYLNQENKNETISFYTGGFTGFCTAFVLCPCDVIKCKAQLNRSRGIAAGFRDVLQATVKTQGVKGLYRGIGMQIIRDMPFYSSFFGSYDYLCHYFSNNTSMPSSAVYFVSGGIAGQIAWVVSIAPDTIKSRIQTSEEPLTIRHTLMTILKERGVRGLFAGIEVAIVRAFPANAALFVGYELTRKLLE